MNKIQRIISLVAHLGCSKTLKQENQGTYPPASSSSEKIKVLNFATFHMGTTTDATSVDFDEKDKKNQEDAQKIAQLIAQFKPTIICVETPRERNEELNNKYQEYLKDPSKISTYYGEVGLVAFEVGRISKNAQLYAIDHKLSYNYMIYDEIVNQIDSTTIDEYYENPYKSTPELNVSLDTLSLFEKLKLMNSQKFLDFLIVVNADILTFAGTENGFEGADEAAKFYQRNLRIYSNINRIPMTKEDRVFILSGGTHTAFLNEFMKRSPKYEVVNTMDYLK